MNPDTYSCVQVFLVTGGWMTLDSTELFDSSEGSWAVAGAKMPYQMIGLRATSIDARVLIFGKFLYI